MRARWWVEEARVHAEGPGEKAQEWAVVGLSALVERGGQAEEDMPIKELDDDSPRTREGDERARLERRVHRGGVDVQPSRVQPDDDQREQEQLRAEHRHCHTPLESALPARVDEDDGARETRDDLRGRRGEGG